MNAFTVFRGLHEPGRFLLLPNAWDAGSARLIEACDAAAIATSSAAMSWARGVRDGEQLRSEELIDIVGSIARAADVPVRWLAGTTAAAGSAAGAAIGAIDNMPAAAAMMSVEIRRLRVMTPPAA